MNNVSLTCVLDPGWITLTLKTITRDHRNLQLITLDASEVLTVLQDNYDDGNPTTPVDVLGQNMFNSWIELDLLLAKLSESHSFNLEVLYDLYDVMPDEDQARSWVECLLPEFMGKGTVKLVRLAGG